MTAPLNERLKYLLTYDPLTGRLCHTGVRVRRRGHAGAPAGFLHRDGFRRVMLDRRLHFAMNLAWQLHFGEPPTHQVVPHDGDRANAAAHNLRDSGMPLLNAERAVPRA